MTEVRVPFLVMPRLPVLTVVISHFRGSTYVITFSTPVDDFDISHITSSGVTLSGFIGNRVVFCVNVVRTQPDAWIQVRSEVVSNAWGVLNEASNLFRIP